MSTTRDSSPEACTYGSNSGPSNGYCSSPASSASSSASNGKTKNVGVGANLSKRSVTGANGVGVKPALSPNSGAGTYPSTEMVAQVRSTTVLSRNASPPGNLPSTPVPGQGAPALPPGNPPKGSTSSDGPSTATSSNKMVSQNINGTFSVTSVPSNESELQLYRVLQRANLLNYYDVMIELGGDDVQQLCDAGEEEFLEIMALVGMASKPLHVRRLQKSLQEWMTQPHLFQIPLINASHFPQLMPGIGSAATPLREAGTEASNSIAPSATSNIPIRPIAYHSSTGAPTMAGLPPGFVNPMDIMKNLQSKLSSLRNPSPTVGSAMKSESHGSNSNSPLGHLLAQAAIMNGGTGQSLVHSAHNGIGRIPVNGIRGGHSPTGSMDQHPTVVHDQRMLYASRHRSEDGSSPSRSADSPQLDSRTSLSPVPFLQDGEVERLAEAAANLAANLLPSAIEPRLSAKKKVCVEYETIIRIPENDPGRLDVVRKFAAIYGRQDCKRKVQKPLTLHELTVNEAAAQLCSRLPALLTRRDELFPLARQVVKDAGLPYGAGIASIISSHISMAKGGRHGEDVMKLLSHHNNNNIPGLMANGYGKRAKLDARGAEDLRSPYSHDGESNSEDSHLTNDSFSSQNRSMSSSRQVSEDLTNENMGHSHSATNGALDMSSTAGGTNADEPNDLTISKAVNIASSKSYPNNSGRRSSSPHLLPTRSNIKSEPVS